jgi:excisionase family DNA binding protein
VIVSLTSAVASQVGAANLMTGERADVRQFGMRRDRLLKPAEVADRLGVSRAWLYEAARTGRIPSVRLGDENGPLRFIEDDLDAWLRQARGTSSGNAYDALGVGDRLFGLSGGATHE